METRDYDGYQGDRQFGSRLIRRDCPKLKADIAAGRCDASGKVISGLHLEAVGAENEEERGAGSTHYLFGVDVQGSGSSSSSSSWEPAPVAVDETEEEVTGHEEMVARRWGRLVHALVCNTARRRSPTVAGGGPENFGIHYSSSCVHA